MTILWRVGLLVLLTGEWGGRIRTHCLSLMTILWRVGLLVLLTGEWGGEDSYTLLILNDYSMKGRPTCLVDGRVGGGIRTHCLSLMTILWRVGLLVLLTGEWGEDSYTLLILNDYSTKCRPTCLVDGRVGGRIRTHCLSLMTILWRVGLLVLLTGEWGGGFVHIAYP